MTKIRLNLIFRGPRIAYGVNSVLYGNYLILTTSRSEWYWWWPLVLSGRHQATFSPKYIFLKFVLGCVFFSVDCARQRESFLQPSSRTKQSSGEFLQYSWWFPSQGRKLQRLYSLRRWERIMWPLLNLQLLEMSLQLVPRNLLLRFKCFSPCQQACLEVPFW